jgi:haloacetate dehalogenase
VLVVIGEDETQLRDAPEIWRSWAGDLTVTQVPGGHFIPEEAPQQLAGILSAFLA